jgi:hypothetical protein
MLVHPVEPSNRLEAGSHSDDLAVISAHGCRSQRKCPAKVSSESASRNASNAGLDEFCPVWSNWSNGHEFKGLRCEWEFIFRRKSGLI